MKKILLALTTLSTGFAPLCAMELALNTTKLSTSTTDSEELFAAPYSDLETGLLPKEAPVKTSMFTRVTQSPYFYPTLTAVGAAVCNGAGLITLTVCNHTECSVATFDAATMALWATPIAAGAIHGAKLIKDVMYQENK